VEDPAHEVIDEFGLRESLVATFMSDDPKTGCDEASGEAVDWPKGKAGERIGGGGRKGDVLRSDEGFNIRGGFINGTDEEEVPQAVWCVRHAVMWTTYD
jgi:hypothetical protein